MKVMIGVHKDICLISNSITPTIQSPKRCHLCPEALAFLIGIGPLASLGICVINKRLQSVTCVRIRCLAEQCRFGKAATQSNMRTTIRERTESEIFDGEPTSCGLTVLLQKYSGTVGGEDQVRLLLMARLAS